MKSFKKINTRFVKYLSGLKPSGGWLHDGFIFWGIATSLLLIIILVLTIFFNLRPTSEPMALHYNVLVGVDLVKKGLNIYQLPLIAVIVLVYNLILAKKLYDFESYASYILVTASILVSAGILGSVLALTFLP